MKTLPHLAIIALIAAGPIARAGELLPADRPIAEVVDAYLDARLSEAKVKAASQTDDAGLVRRLMLDLAGRIPTAAETKVYVESSDPEKRVRLVETLLASPGFVRHQADEFDAQMMAGTSGESMRTYLARALAENRPWDQIFREVMLADESQAARAGTSEFLKARTKDLDRLTNDVSSVFFGVNISCAKCHDHPRVPDWKQDHFYGMKSFFSRTFKNDGFLGERSEGPVKFQTTKGQEREARLMFLTGRVVDDAKELTKKERKAEEARIQEAKKKKQAPPPPKFSARAQLVEVALRPGEREFFARAIVNRLWARFFGQGLVMPLDQMHSENPPSHPELLQWLARDTIEHGYSLRRLIKGLVLSRAYGRSSRWEGGETPDPRLFALAPVRPLSPIQLARSIWLATTDPAVLPADLPPAALEKRIEGFEGRARGMAGSLARPGEEYQIGVAEALFLSNSDRVKEILANGGDRLVGRMLKAGGRDERVALAIRNVLSRAPADDEVSLLGDYLRQRDDRAAEGCRQLVWALLTESEFRFNY